MPHPRPSHRQPDLFASEAPSMPMAASERMKLLPLLSALLKETLAVAVTVEADDEDHA